MSPVNPASSPLRSQDRAGQRNTFFATCWLIVEPPRSRSVSASAARMPATSKPQCRQKFAVLRRRRRSAAGAPTSPSSEPSRARSRAEAQSLGQHQVARRRVHPAEEQRPARPRATASRSAARTSAAPEPPQQPPRPPNDHRRLPAGKACPAQARFWRRNSQRRRRRIGDDANESGTAGVADFTLTHPLAGRGDDRGGRGHPLRARAPARVVAGGLSLGRDRRSGRRRRRRPRRRLPHPRLAPLHAALARHGGRRRPPAHLDDRGDRRSRRPRRLAAGAAGRLGRRRLRLARAGREARPEAARAGACARSTPQTTAGRWRVAWKDLPGSSPAGASLARFDRSRFRLRPQGDGGIHSCTRHAQLMHNSYAKEKSEDCCGLARSGDRAVQA